MTSFSKATSKFNKIYVTNLHIPGAANNKVLVLQNSKVVPDSTITDSLQSQIDVLTSNYNKITITDTYTNGNGTTAVSTVNFARYIDGITASITEASANIPSGAVSNWSFSSTLPVELRRSLNFDSYARVVDGGAFQQGMTQITSSGGLNIYKDPNGIATFTNAAVGGFSNFSFGYALD